MPRRSPTITSSRRRATLWLAAALLGLLWAAAPGALGGEQPAAKKLDQVKVDPPKSDQAGPAPSKADQSKADKSEPINITSDRMESNAGGDVVTFTGNVVATQADGMLKARLVRVFYRTLPEAAGAQGAEPRREVTRIEAEGEVMIVQAKKIATGERAVYSAAERTIVLTGSARVRQERDWVAGSKVTFYLDENRSVVEGAPGRRVTSIIYPKGEGEAEERRP